MRSAMLLVALAVAAHGQKLGAGRAATPDEVKAWDISISAGGSELPAGSGTVAEGREVYDRRCKRCHGDAGKGGDEGALVGGQGSLATPKPLKTVGSFWPRATTLFDYIRRAMPYAKSKALSNDELYAVSAFILSRNGIIAEDFVLDAKTLPQVKMPNRDGFINAWPDKQ